ncbi:MAG TPA: hypothetical protein VN442_23590 [Bryobacteraceae bacterium]|nr:hypothetical protein [Bryobacteraceae bacterium]
MKSAIHAAATRAGLKVGALPATAFRFSYAGEENELFASQGVEAHQND